MSPIEIPLTLFQNMHGPPQPGVARFTRLNGKSSRKPHNGPRRYQALGHAVMPTMKPIRSLMRYQAQTATSPRIPSTLNLYGIGPWRNIGSQPTTRPTSVETTGKGNLLTRAVMPSSSAQTQGESQ